MPHCVFWASTRAAPPVAESDSKSGEIRRVLLQTERYFERANTLVDDLLRIGRVRDNPVGLRKGLENFQIVARGVPDRLPVKHPLDYYFPSTARTRSVPARKAGRL